MIGQTLGGRFTVVGLVGVGSMGKVYRAIQRGTERAVALKVLKRERAQDASAKARFLREARASSSLASPHTVRTFDFGEGTDGELFLVMELLDGESLAARLTRDGRLGVTAAVETTLSALKSLEEAHAKGLIHRDLKPANIFYARVATGAGFDEITKVLDFGGAKFIAPARKPMNAVDTQEGFVVGTPRYMSPEQAEGLPLDGRSDLYALGAVLYHMLTGRAPFTDDDPEVVLAKHIRAMPERPSVVCPEAMLTPELEGLIMRVLAKDREQRPKDATAFLQELAVFVDGPNSTRLSSGVLRASIPPPGLAPAASSTSAAVARIAFESERPPPPAPRAAARARTLGWAGALLGAGIVVVAAWLASARATGAGPTLPVSAPRAAVAVAPVDAVAATAIARTPVTGTPQSGRSSSVPVETLPRVQTSLLRPRPSPLPPQPGPSPAPQVPSAKAAESAPPAPIATITPATPSAAPAPAATPAAPAATSSYSTFE